MRLLVPADGSPAAVQALRLLAAYQGDRALVQPIVCNVQRWPLKLWPAPAFDPAPIERALLEQGEATAAQARRALEAAGFAVESAVRLGVPAPAIVQLAQDLRAELVVMGTRGRQGPLALGSVASRVVNASGMPVLLVRPEARLPQALGRELRALLAIDGSPQAEKAAAQLARWRSWLGRLRVDLLYVQEPMTVLEALLPPRRDLLEQWSGRVGVQAMESARALLAAEAVAHEVHQHAGDPAPCIAQAADQLGSDMVVMGTRGLGAAHHAFIGSVALGAAALSPVPVALVP